MAHWLLFLCRWRWACHLSGKTPPLTNGENGFDSRRVHRPPELCMGIARACAPIRVDISFYFYRGGKRGRHSPTIPRVSPVGECLPLFASQLTFSPIGCYTLLTSNREYSGILIEKKQQIMFASIKNFFSEAKNEIRHVNWPTRQEATRLTFIVIGIAVGLAVFLGSFDYLFSYLIKTFILA